jgi:hypothetical protein
MDKHELLEKLYAARGEFEDALARVRADKVEPVSVYGEWSVKDLLAHVGFWERRVHYLLDTLLKGEEIQSLGLGDVDAVNAHVFKEHHDQAYADVRVWEADGYRALADLIEQTDEQSLFDGNAFTWTKGRPFYEFIADNTYGHWEEHLPALIEAGSE